MVIQHKDIVNCGGFKKSKHKELLDKRGRT